MRRIRTFLAASVTLGLAVISAACARSDAAPASVRPAAAAPAATAAPTKAPGPTFDATVRPVLEARCTPCHYPGGKMYERLPFDQPPVVAAHADGIRRRLKGPDLEALEKWLATIPASPRGASGF
jgi:hypothetical protein